MERRRLKQMENPWAVGRRRPVHQRTFVMKSRIPVRTVGHPRDQFLRTVSLPMEIIPPIHHRSILPTDWVLPGSISIRIFKPVPIIPPPSACKLQRQQLQQRVRQSSRTPSDRTIRACHRRIQEEIPQPVEVNCNNTTRTCTTTRNSIIPSRDIHTALDTRSPLHRH